jgi:hypothetical protein
MLNFRCAYCEAEIQAEYAHVGEFVSCPLCEADIAVPDPWLPVGAEYQGFDVGAPRASSMLWNTYKASRSSRFDETPENALLRIPSLFFLKRVKDFGAFGDIVVKSGTMGVKRIPPLVDFSLEPGKRFFAFEFFESLDAGEFVSRYGALEVAEALGVARRVAITLRAAWRKHRAVHKNVLPRNIRINGKLKVRVMNFGLSRYFLEDRTLLEQGFNVWDHRYMSPEFATAGKGDTQRCDIYALGCLLYFLLTGYPPHDGVPKKELPNAPALDLKYFRSDAPDALCALVQLMTMRNPATRLEDWDEVVERIERIVGGKKVLKSVGGKRYMITRPKRDKPVALTTDPGFPAQEKIKLKKVAERKLEEMSDTIAKPASAVGPRSGFQPPSSGGKGVFNGNAGLVIVVAAAVAVVLFFAVYAALSRDVGGGAAPSDTVVDRASRVSIWSARLAALDAWFAAHPNDYDDALRRYGALVASAEVAGEKSIAEAAKRTLGEIRNKRKWKSVETNGSRR